LFEGFVLGVCCIWWVLYFRVFVGSVLRCLLLGCRLDSLGILEALRAFCVLRGTLRFFVIYNITYQKKKKSLY
jgi:hypothetical protein